MFAWGPELKYPVDCDIVAEIRVVVTPGTPIKEAGGTGVGATFDDNELVVKPAIPSSSTPELWTPANNCCGGGTAL